jgi:hypothetical protein
MSNGQDINFVVGLIDLIDGAVDMRAFSVEQMAKRPPGFFRFGRNGTAVREAFEAIHRFLTLVKPAGGG